MLQVQGAEQPVRLASLQVDVEVAGGAAETRVQMVFFNPNNRILEGKLQFPLAPGQVVSGFALDVDGRLRAAVPVEKARAQQVFEDIARRRVDPGLLQTTIGNNYELRVYPLLPGKTRTVELRIVEPAASRLQVPLGYADRVDALALSLRVPGAAAAPELVGASALGLRFERDANGGFVARTTRTRHGAAEGADRAAPAAARPGAGDRHRRARRAELLHPRAAGGRSAARRGRCRIASRSSGMLRARAHAASSTASWPCSMPTSRRCATPASAWFASPTSPPRRSASRFAAATGRPCARRSRRRSTTAPATSARCATTASRPKRSGSATASPTTARRGGSPSRCRCSRSAAPRAATRRRCRRSPTRAAAAASTSRRRRARARPTRCCGAAPMSPASARSARASSSSSRRARRRAGSSSPAC